MKLPAEGPAAAVRPVRLATVESFPIRIPRDLAAATGTAGSPTQLESGAAPYRWSAAYPALYAVHFETALIRIRTEDGLTAWGESQAPLAPPVVCAIIDHLLAPLLTGQTFGGSRQEIADWWLRLYSAMRVRGQTGGFMLDAISGLDLALWDLAGKMAGRPVSKLIAEAPRPAVPSYLSGLAGETLEGKLAFARRYPGFRHFKLYLGTCEQEILDTMDALRDVFGQQVRVGVDALWHLAEDRAAGFGEQLDARNALWLECPFPPEDVEAHARLARSITTPIALGESYRTRYELAPFFKAGAIGVLQPDLGRTGITESLHLAGPARERGIPLAPHVSIAFGPQIAAAVHLAAAVPECSLLEFNPTVFELATRFTRTPLRMDGPSYLTPELPGLGADLKCEELAAASLFKPGLIP
ncbi:MAG: mandelate racemase/muconate lactonizing enzyme family protein [Bryobacterales bacterium]|nr:mandelate racemase/muconate lactonizing enzyme family protein [Bryobacterales bacterium]